MTKKPEPESEPSHVHLQVRVVHMERLYGDGPAGFSVVIDMVCERCGERGQFSIQGHHVATFQRVFTDVRTRYPADCVELPPTDSVVDKAKVM
jgi:hypothetical protein